MISLLFSLLTEFDKPSHSAAVCPTVCAAVAWCERYSRLLDKLSVQLSHARSVHTVQLLHRQFVQQSYSVNGVLQPTTGTGYDMAYISRKAFRRGVTQLSR